MKSFKFISKNISIAPRKMFTAANVLKNKEVNDSLENLKLSINNNKSIRIVYKLIKGYYKQIINNQKDGYNLENSKIFIEYIRVDRGIIRKKIFFRAKGRADTVKNRMTNLIVSFVAK